MTGTVHKSATISEGLCKQLIAQYRRRTRNGSISQGTALRELINVVYAQGHQAGIQSIYKEVFDE